VPHCHVQIFVRTRLPAEQRVDAPTSVNVDGNAFFLKQKNQFDYVFIAQFQFTSLLAISLRL
jgi:hypothetical protein